MKSGSEFAKLKQQLVEEKLGVVQRCRICGADIRSAWPGDNVCVECSKVGSQQLDGIRRDLNIAIESLRVIAKQLVGL